MTEIFLQWLKHFSWFAESSQEDEALPIVDGPPTHKRVNVISFAI
jgi:hypothetical protein